MIRRQASDWVVTQITLLALRRRLEQDPRFAICFLHSVAPSLMNISSRATEQGGSSKQIQRVEMFQTSFHDFLALGLDE